MSDKIDGYAAAVTAVASVEGNLATVADELYQFARALESNDELRTTLTDRAIPASRRLGVVESLLDGRAHPTTINLVSMLVGADRGGDLVAVADQVIQRAADARGQQVAEVRSAIALTQDQVDRLAEALGRAIGSSVDVQVVIDPSVMGGLVAQVGDTVIDGSIRTRLEKLKERV
jgi:F-type H+-transporting ATPase subunit delta